MPDRLSNPVDQISVFAFLETIDTKTIPFVQLEARRSGDQILVGFDSVNGALYSIESRTNLTSTATVITNVTGNGQRLEVPLAIDVASRFLRLLSP